MTVIYILLGIIIYIGLFFVLAGCEYEATRDKKRITRRVYYDFSYDESYDSGLKCYDDYK